MNSSTRSLSGGGAYRLNTRSIVRRFSLSLFISLAAPFSVFSLSSVSLNHCSLHAQDFILEHYSEDGANYEEAIVDLMETRQVSKIGRLRSNGLTDNQRAKKRNAIFLLFLKGNANADQRCSGHRVVVALLQSTVLHRAKILPA